MRNESSTFISSDLDRIEIGSIDIGAPLLNNIIQIHASEQDGKTKLRVDRKTPDIIELYRQDDRLIQAEVVEIHPLDLKSVTAIRNKIFEEPISKLFFMNVAESNNKKIWVATGAGLNVPNIELLQIFASVVGENTRNKQKRNALETKRSIGSLSIN
jgi:hypothetical protein